MTREEANKELCDWLEQMIQHGVPSHSAKRKALACAISALSEETVSLEQYQDLQHCYVILGATLADYIKKSLNDAEENDKALSAEPKCDNCKEYGSYKCTKCDGETYYKTEPKAIRCGECIRHDNCWIFDEHKDDNGTCVWAERNNITESPNDVVEKNDEVIERPIIEHDREWIIGCIKHDGYLHTDRFDKANNIIVDALESCDRPSWEWIPLDGKLPKVIGRHVLVTIKWADDDLEVCEMCPTVADRYNIIAFQDLPEPYQGEPIKSELQCVGAKMKGGDDE